MVSDPEWLQPMAVKFWLQEEAREGKSCRYLTKPGIKNKYTPVAFYALLKRIMYMIRFFLRFL